MVGIVILNFNNSSQTISCVSSLCRFCGEGNWKLCVVDNASRQEEYAKLSEVLQICPDAHIIRSEENGGYARGNDLGCDFFASDASVDKILILNDDTRFTMDILTPMEAYLDSHPDCGVVFPLVLAPDGTIDQACLRRQKSVRDLFIQATSLGRFGLRRREFLPTDAFVPCPHNNLPEAFPTEVPPGSCMMLPKDYFKAIGWLDPGTFLYFEEHIIAAKLLRDARSCILLPYLRITHLGASTTRKQPSKAIYRHWRNSYLYFMKEYSSVPRALQQFLRFRTWLKTLL